MTTQALTFNYSPQSVAWASAYALWAFLRAVALLILGGALLAGVFAVVVAFWLPICQIAGCIGLIALFGWATYPRSKVKVRP